MASLFKKAAQASSDEAAAPVLLPDNATVIADLRAENARLRRENEELRSERQDLQERVDSMFGPYDPVTRKLAEIRVLLIQASTKSRDIEKGQRAIGDRLTDETRKYGQDAVLHIGFDERIVAIVDREKSMMSPRAELVAEILSEILHLKEPHDDLEH